MSLPEIVGSKKNAVWEYLTNMKKIINSAFGFLFAILALLALFAFPQTASAQLDYFQPPTFATNYTVNVIYTNSFKREIEVAGCYSNCVLWASFPNTSGMVPVAAAGANTFGQLQARVGVGQTFAFSNNVAAGLPTLFLNSTNYVQVPNAGR